MERLNINENDAREHLNIVMIGHVDAGKSTLSGNILYLMGMIDQRTIEQFKREAKLHNRESWFFAYIMDTSEEERKNGKTIEVGRAYFETQSRRFTILDAPGHKNYVPHMIQGATQADIGILIISARKGEFETGFEKGGQTREHAMLAKTLGINKLIVAINKMDEANWEQNRFDECVDKLKPFLRSCGFAVKRDVLFVPISGLNGDNIKTRITIPWYHGESLIEYLNQINIDGRNPDGPLRVPIIDNYNDRGTISMGKVESGVLQTGQKVLIMPTNINTTVDKIYINEKLVQYAKPGENVSIHLDCELNEISKGFILCDSDSPGKLVPLAVHTFVAQIALMDMLAHRPILTVGYKCILHIHTIAQECIITKLLYPIDPKTNKPIKKRIAFIKQGQSAICQIQVKQSITIETFKNIPQLGRLALRDEGKTIAIGKVLSLEKN